MKTGLVFSWDLALEAPQCVRGLFEVRADYRLEQRSRAHLRLPTSRCAPVLCDSLLSYKLLSACLVVALGFLEGSRPGPGHAYTLTALAQVWCKKSAPHVFSQYPKLLCKHQSRQGVPAVLQPCRLVSWPTFLNRRPFPMVCV